MDLSNISAAHAGLPVVLYSSHPVLGAGLQSILAESHAYRVGAICTTIDQFRKQVGQCDGGVALVEVTADVTLSSLRETTVACGQAAVVLWVDQISVELASHVLSFGVRGILRKSASIEVHMKCFDTVARGEIWVEKTLCDELLRSRRIAITPRERQLMVLLSQGLKNKEIAFTLGITEGTVKVYLSRLFQKVGANDRFDLALFALRHFTPGESWKSDAGTAAQAASMPEFIPHFVTRPAEGRLQ